MSNAEFGIRNFKMASLTILWLIPAVMWSTPALAEIKVIEADSNYIIGDNDSKVDARRIATQEAKRKALELAGTYVESMTVVKNYQLSKDEIKTYAAGVLETEIVVEQMRGTTERPEIYIKARCRLDTDVLAAQIDKYRENEDLQEQLDASAKENDDLKKERDALVKQLAAEKDKSKAAETRKQLDTVLSKEEANDKTKTVWINVGSQLVEVDEDGRQIKQADLDSSTVVLQQAIKVNPDNQNAHFMLATLYQKKSDFPAAEKELRYTVQRHPRHPAPHMKLGVFLKQQHNYEGALEQFHIVERMQPKNPMMLFHTGTTLKNMNKCGQAVNYLERFVNDARSQKSPKKRERAIHIIENCEKTGKHRRRFRL
jgi:Tfp pilus assembly protein PilF